MSENLSPSICNILLFGNRKSGKSLFINSIANYFTYESFDEALKVNKPIAVTPFETELTLSTFKDIIISNQKHVNNKSNITKAPKFCAYLFKNEKSQLFIIKTPAVEEIWKHEENKKAFSDVMRLFNKIHGILILLKASDCRLNTNFRNNMNEILMLLHTDTAPIIKFVITHTRGFVYKPYPVLSVLTDYLNELKEKRGITIELNADTVFCIDNEGYIFQCEWNQNKEYQNEKKQFQQNYKKSWELSRKTIFILLEKLYAYGGYKSYNTCSVNEARIIIHCAIGPLVAIIALIERTLKQASRQANIDSLRKSGEITGFNVKIEEVCPQTICTSTQCLGAIPLSGTNYFNINYRNVCHENCILKNLRLHKFPEPALEDCQAFDLDGKCMRCSCNVKKHMNISYRYLLQPKMIKLTEKTLLHEAMLYVGHNISEQKMEQMKIMDALIKFMWYYNRNAIIEYNNAVEHRLKFEIRAEKAASIQKVKGCSEVMERLRTLIINFKNQMEAFTTSVEKGNEVEVTAKDVQEILENLFTMKHNGKNIKTLYEAEGSRYKEVKENPCEIVSCSVKYLPIQ